MRSRLGLGVLAAMVGLAWSSSASAVAPPAHGANRSLELRDGSEGRRGAEFHAKPQRARTKAAVRRFEAELGGRLLGLFDATTDVPRRAWGFSAPAPGSAADGLAAWKVAQELLERHAELLAPGAAPSDFQLFVDHVEPRAGSLRSLGLWQHWRGLPVLGGHLGFRFKNDRLFGLTANTFPHVDAKMPTNIVADDVALAAARAWILEDAAAATTVSAVDGPFVLPMATSTGFDYRVVVRVRVEARSPVGLFDVYVDASSGEAVAREQRLVFETAHLSIEAWERGPSFGPRREYPANRVSLDLPGNQASGQTGVDGAFSFEGEVASGTALLVGDHVRVRNIDGDDISLSVEASDGEEIVWSAPGEVDDAQLNAYVHAGLINDYARTFAPDLDFLDDTVQVQVNIEDVCNAYSDLTRIHFFKSGSGCENTARLADVVYHEYGHSLHGHAFIFCGPGAGTACLPDTGGGLSEGISDYFSATFTGDPKMGRGFFLDSSPLRDLEPEGMEHVWPDDVVGEVHYDGLIIGGALWDLRTLLVEELGEAEGVALANHLAYQGIRRAYDIPDMYPEMLFADDDDGDLANGTPHECQINAAMGRHGLRPIAGEVVGPSLAPPSQDGYDVSLRVDGLSTACGESLSNALLTWADTNDATRSGSIPMTVGDDGIARGRLPSQQPGHVIRFDVRAENAGAGLQFPQNPADPTYQMYVGELTPIYCTSFESDPFSEGWSHELVDGVEQEGADDWMWGAPKGNGTNGDPPEAFSGQFAVGQDFSPEENWNGLYQPDHHTALVSPVIPTAGFDRVRLQYRRWLAVEDGFFDQASILADDEYVWSNFQSGDPDGASVHHQDREWRFQDVDITPQSLDGTVQLRWELRSDGGLEMGGWAIDDVCVLGVTVPGQTSGATTATTGAGDAVGVGGSGGGAGGGDGLEGEPSASGGCACEATGATGRSSGVAGLAVAAALAAATRRRRQTKR